jgi:hypothetical protein
VGRWSIDLAAQVEQMFDIVQRALGIGSRLREVARKPGEGHAPLVHRKWLGKDRGRERSVQLLQIRAPVATIQH